MSVATDMLLCWQIASDAKIQENEKTQGKRARNFLAKFISHKLKNSLNFEETNESEKTKTILPDIEILSPYKNDGEFVYSLSKFFTIEYVSFFTGAFRGLRCFC